MLNLNHLKIDLNKARTDHYNFFACYVTKKITGRTCSVSSVNTTHPIDRPKYCSVNKIQRHTFRYANSRQILTNFVLHGDNLKKILLGTPTEINRINSSFISVVDNHFGPSTYADYLDTPDKRKSSFHIAGVHDFFLDVDSVFNYSRLSKNEVYSSYHLTENLGVRSCAYCNRTYALTHRKRDGKRLMNPQLDHWFPNSKFPLLQISFHNLIPSCEVCNSRVKNDIVFDLNHDYHPYQQEKEKIEFDYYYGVDQKFHIFFKSGADYPNKIRLTSEKMCIDQMYEAHADELQDMITLKQEYSKSYLESLQRAFPRANLSKELMYRLAFGTELYEENFHKRPMSKFKFDILKQLGVI